MQWMTPYLIVLIHCIQASSYLLIHYLIVLIHCIQCVLGAAAHTGFVLKLIKSIYGLKQAGRQWHKKLDSVLQDMGFTLVRCDNSI